MSPAGPAAPESERRSTLARVVAAALIGAGVLLVLFVHAGQLVEAQLNAGLLNGSHLASAEVVGASVLFLRGQEYAGYTVDAGCTATLLVVPFFFLTSGLLSFSRLSLRRCLVALSVVTVVIYGANQGRLLLIAAAMRISGGRSGFELAHVFLGTVVSTFGVLIGLVLFVLVLTGWRPGPRVRRVG